MPASDMLSASLALTRYLLQHRMARFLPFLLCSIALAGLVGGCSGSSVQSSVPSQAEVREALAGSPPPLRAVHAQANQLLDGGADGFEARLRELRGYPVVVNKWGAWCDPCRCEMPHFQSQALKHGKRIAFLGVDAEDHDPDARELLEKIPLTYPSFRDPRLNVSAVFNATTATPSTAFYDSKGELAYVKQGVYLDEQDLAEDIDRYAR
jgi:thiol-disulfide isomerase/thioredoxin